VATTAPYQLLDLETDSQFVSKEAVISAIVELKNFYGRPKFCCKTVQFCATHYESEITKYLAFNDMQSSENLRNSLGSNYKSAALPTLATGYRITELCAWSEATLYFSSLELSAFSVLLPRTKLRCS
jgi:hypothetical protein